MAGRKLWMALSWFNMHWRWLCWHSISKKKKENKKESCGMARLEPANSQTSQVY
jgi:hypothetical protein